MIQFIAGVFVVWSLFQPDSYWLVPFVVAGIYLRFFFEDLVAKIKDADSAN